MSPRSGAILHRGAAEKLADTTGAAMTAIAQSLLTGPSVTLSKAHLTPQEVTKWIAHQRTQIEAGTFDSRTLTTTISERSWAMIELKIDLSRTLRENPRKDWQEQWDMHIFLAALEEVYALDSKGRFLDAPSIWRTWTSYLSRMWLTSWSRAFYTPSHREM
jgi:hypothetical protein